jgi:hypothetical protein
MVAVMAPPGVEPMDWLDLGTIDPEDPEPAKAIATATIEGSTTGEL